MPQHRSRRSALFVLLISVALLSAACGSSDDGDSGGSGDASSPRVLGQPKVATGARVKVGFVSDGRSDVVDNTAELTAAEAAAGYVNHYLGGVAGHPIDLVTCESHQTPAGATACATKMVDEKVVAVLNGVTGQGGPLFSGLAGSNIPLIVFASLDQDTVLKPGAFVLTNTFGSIISGPAALAHSDGVRRAAVLVIDLPAATSGVKSVGPTFYKNAGVDLDIVTVPPGTADMTPQIQAEMGKEPGQIQIIGDAAFCTSALKAMKTLGFRGTIVPIAQCIDEGTSASLPGGYGGMRLVTVVTTDPSDTDNKIYRAAMDKYAKGTAKGGTAQGGFLVVWALQRAMADSTGAVTAATVTSTFTAMPTPVPIPFGAGTTFQCGSKPISFIPNICSLGLLQTTLDEKGQGTSFKELDTKAITKL